MPIINANGVSISYETFGDSSDPNVIFIQGIASQLVHWPTELMEKLAAEGYHVVIFDNRDVGLSHYYDHLDTPSLDDAFASKWRGQAFKPPYTLKDMAHDVVLLMDALNIEKVHLVGISMGGIIAQYFAFDYPERLLTLTLGATSSGDTHLPPPKSDVMNFLFQLNPSSTDIESAIERHVQQYHLYNHPDDIHPDVIRKVHRRAYNRAYHPEGSHRQLLAVMFDEPRGEQLKQITVPTLIIHGDYDPVVPLEHGQQLADLFPSSELVIIPNMGHGIPQRIYNSLVRLLSNHFSHAQ